MNRRTNAKMSRRTSTRTNSRTSWLAQCTLRTADRIQPRYKQLQDLLSSLYNVHSSSQVGSDN